MLVDEFDDANANAIASLSMSTEAAAVEDAAAAKGAAMEPAEGRRAAVVIRGVSKTYNPEGGWGAWWNGASAPTRAVRSLNLALYEGQVTGLLGPNGAGKSTTVAMLTGLAPPTEGDALVAGHSLRGALADARRVLGVCPQTNVLFPSLTCEEHLRVYATLKGVPAEEVEEACREKVREVGLENKARARVETLSGGMKRRLQMAMALVGPSRVVFLDEPTSGLDPKSRRDAWRLIRAAAEGGRCVVLTTHFLEEGGSPVRSRRHHLRRETSVRGVARVPQERVGGRVFAHDDVRRVAREVGCTFGSAFGHVLQGGGGARDGQARRAGRDASTRQRRRGDDRTSGRERGVVPRNSSPRSTRASSSETRTASKRRTTETAFDSEGTACR